MEGPKLSNFKIGGQFLQNGENRGPKLQLSLTSMLAKSSRILLNFINRSVIDLDSTILNE